MVTLSITHRSLVLCVVTASIFAGLNSCATSDDHAQKSVPSTNLSPEEEALLSDDHIDRKKKTSLHSEMRNGGKAQETQSTVDDLLPVNEGVPTARTVFNWQSYFKTPPTSKDRDVLEKSLARIGRTKNKDDLLKRARGEFSLGKYALAEASYRELLRLDRAHFDAMIELAGVYHKTRKSDEAMQVLSDVKDFIAQQETPSSAQLFRYRYLLALVEIQRGKRTNGHDILSDLIAQDPSFIPGYAALASSYLAIGKETVAKFVVERGLDRGRDDATLLNLLGVIADKQNQLTAARDFYNRSLQINDSFAPALVNRANIYIRQQEYKLAEEDLKKAMELDPLNTDAMISLAVVQRRTGRHKLARSQINRVLELTPENAEARFNLAIIMRDHESNNTEAMRLFREVSQTEKAPSDLKLQAKSFLDELKNL